MLNVVLSDLHACYHEWVSLLDALGFKIVEGHLINSKQVKLWFIGDLLDRGEYPAETILLTHLLIEQGVLSIAAIGNHDERVYGEILGWERPARLGALLQTMENIEADIDATFVKQIFLDIFDNAPRYTYLKDVGLILTHGSIRPEDLQNSPPLLSSQVGKSDPSCLLTYGESAGTSPNGRPLRSFEWFKTWQEDERLIVFGHNCTQSFRPELYGNLNIIGLDTGCVFGKQLTAYLHETRSFLAVKSIAERDVDPVMIQVSGEPQLARYVELVSEDIFESWLKCARRVAQARKSEIVKSAAQIVSAFEQ